MSKGKNSLAPLLVIAGAAGACYYILTDGGKKTLSEALSSQSLGVPEAAQDVGSDAPPPMTPAQAAQIASNVSNTMNARSDLERELRNPTGAGVTKPVKPVLPSPATPASIAVYQSELRLYMANLSRWKAAQRAANSFAQTL